MNILLAPNPSLRKKASPVKKIGDEERRILSEMAETMYLKEGVGLAAVQVGIHKQLVVIDIGSGCMKLINPVIVKKEGWETQEEGCLSVPDASVKVRRYKKITVDYLNEEGDAVRLNAEGLLARAIQHEIDHLMGKLIIDYLGPLKKLFMMRGRLTINRL